MRLPEDYERAHLPGSVSVPAGQLGISLGKWVAVQGGRLVLIDADPGGFLVGGQREFCRTWPNQETVSVKGFHFLQEEAPDAFGEALARFAAKVRATARG